MDTQTNRIGMLDMIPNPGFCVKNQQIIQVNQAAQAMCITEGTDVPSLLITGQEEYLDCSWKGMALSLSIHGHIHSATVVRTEDADIFLLEPEQNQEQFRAFSLAAMELRGQLDNIMLNADSLISMVTQEDENNACANRMNQSMFRLMRTICNMSDVGRFTSVCHNQMHNVCNLYKELFQKAQGLAEHAGIALDCQIPAEDIWCLIDAEQLERAFWNLISNAMKFTPKGGKIQVSLTRRGRMLLLSIEDNGGGIREDIRSTLFKRYLRQPGIEDSRFGLGLGMVLIHAAANHHGGSVFVDQPGSAGTRVTMTLTIHQTNDSLRSPVLQPDYAGGWDHSLLELSDCLPAALYQSI